MPLLCRYGADHYGLNEENMQLPHQRLQQQRLTSRGIRRWSVVQMGPDSNTATGELEAFREPEGHLQLQEDHIARYSLQSDNLS